MKSPSPGALLTRDTHPPVLDVPDALWRSTAGSTVLVRLGAAAVAALGDWLVLGVIGTTPRELSVVLVGARFVVMASFIALIVPLTSCWVGFVGELLLAVGILVDAGPPLTVLPAVIMMMLCCALVPVLHELDMHRYAAVGRGTTGFLLTPEERRAGYGRTLSGPSLSGIALIPLAALGFCYAEMIDFNDGRPVPSGFPVGPLLTIVAGVLAAHWWNGVVARRTIARLCNRPAAVHLLEWQLVDNWVLLVQPGSDRSIAEFEKPVLVNARGRGPVGRRSVRVRRSGRASTSSVCSVRGASSACAMATGGPGRRVSVPPGPAGCPWRATV